MKSRVAILLALLVVFSAGSVAGWAYGRQEAMKRPQRPSWRSEDMPARVIKGLQQDLELSEDQRAKVEPIVRETWSKIEETQKACGRQIREMVRAQHQQFKGFLSETQWTKLQESEARRAKRHGGGTNAPGGRPPGPPPDFKRP